MQDYKEYGHPDNPPTADELATCIALLQGAKIRAQIHISNPWGLSWLQPPEQELMDSASDAIDSATKSLESLRSVLRDIPREGGK
ncbi:MAG: hypothetical protein MUE44_22260 [Oscillatoriaceae cyanobacterium Prado104]|jgi:hypothetical protein|nr:hypothetical protein [Oscillatoriaceae cyanobacterium Prado104]